MYTVELSPELKRQMAYEIALPMLDEKLQYQVGRPTLRATHRRSTRDDRDGWW